MENCKSGPLLGLHLTDYFRGCSFLQTVGMCEKPKPAAVTETDAPGAGGAYYEDVRAPFNLDQHPPSPPRHPANTGHHTAHVFFFILAFSQNLGLYSCRSWEHA